MKLSMRLTWAAALVASLTSAASAMTPGVYTETVTGRNGDVTVEVTVTADRVQSVRVAKHGETPGIGTLAVEKLPGAITAAQTAGVDGVTGATVTSDAIKSAVTKALAKAGAAAKFTAKKAAGDTAAAAPLVTKADVIVVGAGGAGMVAAATAVDGGAKVVVLEKMAMIGGNTARSEGNMSAIDPEPEKLLDMTPAVRDIIAKYTNRAPCSKEAARLQTVVKKQLAAHDAAGKKYIFDSPELFALQTIMGGDCKNDPKLVLTMAKHATEAMQWLEGQSSMTWFHVPRHWIDVGIGGIYPKLFENYKALSK